MTVGAPGSGNKWSLLDHRQDISDERRAERVSAVRPSSRNNRRGLNASVRFSCVVLVKSMHSFWVLIGRRPRERSAEAEAKNRSSRGLRRQNSREIDSEWATKVYSLELWAYDRSSGMRLRSASIVWSWRVVFESSRFTRDDSKNPNLRRYQSRICESDDNEYFSSETEV